MALLEPFGGEGNEIDTNCAQLEATSCSTSPPFGGGLMGWLGYSWNPVGVEAFLAGEYDQSTPSATFVGSATMHENPLAVGEPRVEQFAFLRFGGMGAIRARVSFQTDLIRFSLAAGFGLSVKEMVLERQTQSNSDNANAYVKNSSAYVSPAISADLAVSIRATKTLAIALGVTTMFENAGSNLASPASTNQILGGGASPPTPLPTPAYHFASGAQTFIGPYVGLQFGP